MKIKTCLNFIHKKKKKKKKRPNIAGEKKN